MSNSVPVLETCTIGASGSNGMVYLFDPIQAMHLDNKATLRSFGVKLATLKAHQVSQRLPSLIGTARTVISVLTEDSQQCQKVKVSWFLVLVSHPAPRPAQRISWMADGNSTCVCPPLMSMCHPSSSEDETITNGLRKRIPQMMVLL